MKNKITKKMGFSEILGKYPEAAEILFESGMHCIGCPMAMQETLEQGALAHGIDPDEIIMKINKRLEKRDKVTNDKK
jgi:hybrid cluster-associated redox disulfide protein